MLPGRKKGQHQGGHDVRVSLWTASRLERDLPSLAHYPVDVQEVRSDQLSLRLKENQLVLEDV